MQQRPEFTAFQLTHYTETLRRELYDAVVSLVWTKTGPDDAIPPCTPAECDLAVHFLYGRWFAVWEDREAARDAPADLQTEVVRVLADPDSPFGIVLQEV